MLGCGGLGLIGISILRARGVKNIVACDIDDAKLEVAAKMGAKSAEHARRRRAKLQGLAAAIDFVGSPATASLGIGALRKGGTTSSAASMAANSCILCRRLRSARSASSARTWEIFRSLSSRAREEAQDPPAPVETRPADEASRALEDLKAGRIVGRWCSISRRRPKTAAMTPFSWNNPYAWPRKPVLAANVVATTQPLAAQAGCRCSPPAAAPSMRFSPRRSR